MGDTGSNSCDANYLLFLLIQIKSLPSCLESHTWYSCEQHVAYLTKDAKLTTH